MSAGRETRRHHGQFVASRWARPIGRRRHSHSTQTRDAQATAKAKVDLRLARSRVCIHNAREEAQRGDALLTSIWPSLSQGALFRLVSSRVLSLLHTILPLRLILLVPLHPVRDLSTTHSLSLPVLLYQHFLLLVCLSGRRHSFGAITLLLVNSLFRLLRAQHSSHFDFAAPSHD